eukprot:m.23448 g.23448  ORF g.23448 m.23448 type:complete len:54 (+) comp14214_c0_seq1:914-1075(+)
MERGAMTKKPNSHSHSNFFQKWLLVHVITRVNFTISSFYRTVYIYKVSDQLIR